MTTTFLDFPGLRKRMTAEPRFGIEMLKMSERLRLEPDYILSVMSAESGIDPAAENKFSPFKDGFATGLIQFIPSTARALGTTTQALKGMSAVEQLQYVERFFAQNGGKIRRDVPGDYYMAVFMPAFVGAPEDMVLGRKDDPAKVPGANLTYASIYKANGPAFDKGGRGFFTVGDVWASTLSRIAAARKKPPIEVTVPGPLVPAAGDLQPSPSLPPAWRSAGGPFDLPVLRIGARGTAVALAQRLAGSDVVTGVFTEAFAVDYVKPLQAAYGLTPDGVIGPLTWECFGFRGPL